MLTSKKAIRIYGTAYKTRYNEVYDVEYRNELTSGKEMSEARYHAHEIANLEAKDYADSVLKESRADRNFLYI